MSEKVSLRHRLRARRFVWRGGMTRRAQPPSRATRRKAPVSLAQQIGFWMMLGSLLSMVASFSSLPVAAQPPATATAKPVAAAAVFTNTATTAPTATGVPTATAKAATATSVPTATTQPATVAAHAATNTPSPTVTTQAATATKTLAPTPHPYVNPRVRILQVYCDVSSPINRTVGFPRNGPRCRDTDRDHHTLRPRTELRPRRIQRLVHGNVQPD